MGTVQTPGVGHKLRQINELLHPARISVRETGVQYAVMLDAGVEPGQRVAMPAAMDLSSITAFLNGALIALRIASGYSANGNGKGNGRSATHGTKSK